jgi:ribosomal protein S6
MALYENVFIARQDVATTQVEALTTQFSELVTSMGGTVSKNEYWGLKSLSYRIKKNRKAHYTLLNIDAPAPAVPRWSARSDQRRHPALHDRARRRARGRPVGHDAEARP